MLVPTRLKSLALPVLLLAASPAAAATSARPSMTRSSLNQATPTVLEIAPLRGAVGQPSLRAEFIRWGNFGAAVSYEAANAPSERSDFTDRSTAFGAEAVYYPLGLNDYPFFGAAGLRFEQADIGRQSPRDATTWARTNADEVNDVWVNHDTYWSVTEAIGYRFLASRLFTASLRLVRDEALMTESHADTQGVLSDNTVVASRGRPAVTQKVILHAGLWLP